LDVGEGQRIFGVDPRARAATVERISVTVRPEWIKLSSGEVDGALPHAEAGS
jgi:hypothetical protein